MDIPISNTFTHKVNELLKQKENQKISEEDFHKEKDAIIVAEAALQTDSGPLLVKKQLEQKVKSLEETYNEEKNKLLQRKRKEQELAAYRNDEENIRAETERHLFRRTVDNDIEKIDETAKKLQTRYTFLQLGLIFSSTITATLAGSDVNHVVIAAAGFVSAWLGAMLTFFKYQDRIYANRKAATDMILERRAYDNYNQEYKNRRDDPQESYMLFSEKITAILSRQMIEEVNLFNPKKQEASKQEKSEKKQETGKTLEEPKKQ